MDSDRLEHLKQLYAEAIAISPLPWTRAADEFDDWGMIRGTKTEENPLGNMPIASTVNEAHFGDWHDAMYARTKGRVLEGEESAAYDAEWKAGPPQAIALAEAIVQIMNAFPELVSENRWTKEPPTEPGWYWLSGFGDYVADEPPKAGVICVTKCGDDLVYEDGDGYCINFDDFVHTWTGHWWCRVTSVIQPPKE